MQQTTIKNKMKFNKKGQVMEQLSALGIGVATLAITLVVVFLILSKTKANTTVAADGNSTAALNTLTTAVADVPNWIPIVVITIIGAILLSLVALFRR